jgi:hypothetical protein
MLRSWLTMPPADAAKMRTQALATFMKRFTVDAMSHDLVRLLRQGALNRNAAFDKRPRTASVER